MKRLNAKQAHKSNKFHKACVEVPTHAVLGDNNQKERCLQ